MVSFVIGEMNLLFCDNLFVFQVFYFYYFYFYFSFIEKCQALPLEKRLAKISYEYIIDVWRHPPFIQINR